MCARARVTHIRPTDGRTVFGHEPPRKPAQVIILSRRHLLTETLGVGTVPCAISLTAEHRGTQEVEATVALVRHGGAVTEPVRAAGVDLANAVFLVSGVCTVDDCNGTRHLEAGPWM